MSKFDTNKLMISSDFYSVQGEGISTGIPSYFVRLAVCNLQCGMSMKFLNAIKKAGPEALADGEIFKGDLELEGKASWTCDSTSQWAIRGENQDFDYLINHWKEQGIYEDIKNGNIHIIWTGGEPTIKQHQESIVNFFNYWNPYNDTVLSPPMIVPPLGFPKRAIIENGVIKKDKNNENVYVDVDYKIANPYNEIETNGTIYIEEPLFRLLDQINCSPKLTNSGMTVKQRIVPEAIKRIMEHSNYQFKFVISTEDDIKELFNDFVEPFNIPLKNVVCMPGLDSQTDFHERTQFVLEMAKKYMFRGLTRLHISAWDKTLNV
jgi:organic radical activating enzyme